ncbi:MAG: PIN domain-containing protein [Candidatus Woesearchaeota archaeon]
MSKYCIDSSVWISYIRGESGKVHECIEMNELVCSSLALVEVADICTVGGMNELQVKELLQFITSKCKPIPINISLSVNASRIKHKQRKTKNKFSIVDAMHYATALNEHATLVTRDNDFTGLSNVLMI